MFWASFLFVLSISSPSELQPISKRVERLVEESFPELQGLEIKLKSMEAKDFFFATHVENAYRRAKSRQYIVLVNTDILEREISSGALDGILAHELQHLVHYSKMNFFELAWLYLRYELLEDEDYIVEYERRTDREALARGYHSQLEAYRIWLYKQFSSAIRKRKKLRYMTPDEIKKEAVRLAEQ